MRNVPLHSDRFIPIPKRTRLRSDSLVNLHQKKKNKLHEHLVTGEYNLEYCRLLKLQSEVIPHRLNHGYYMSGKEMALRDRYAVPEDELLRLKKLNLSANAELYYGKGMRYVNYLPVNKYCIGRIILIFLLMQQFTCQTQVHLMLFIISLILPYLLNSHFM